MGLQVLADPAQVDLQPRHARMRVVAVTEDVVQVEVEDVGVEAADLHVVLKGGGDEVRGRVGSGQENVTVTGGDSHLGVQSVDFGHQSGAGLVVQLQILSLTGKKNKNRSASRTSRLPPKVQEHELSV